MDDGTCEGGCGWTPNLCKCPKNEKSGLTEHGAKWMLERLPDQLKRLTDHYGEKAVFDVLTRHYGEPVRKLSKFCDAMRKWFDAIVHNNEDPAMLETFDLFPPASREKPGSRMSDPEHQHGRSYFKILDKLNIDIAKSYLLGRLIYDEEPLRTEKCPVHKGHWDGQTQLMRGCTYGCDGSGWLKTPEMVQKRLEQFRKHSKMTDEEVVAKAKAGDLPKPDLNDTFGYYQNRYIFEWLYHLGQIELVPENERG